MHRYASANKALTRMWQSAFVILLAHLVFAHCFPIDQQSSSMTFPRPADVQLRSDPALRTDQEDLIKESLAKEVLRRLIRHIQTASSNQTPLTKLLAQLFEKNSWRNAHSRSSIYKGVSSTRNVPNRESVSNQEDDSISRMDRSYYGWMDFGKRSIDDDFTY